MPLVTRNEIIYCSNPKLDIFTFDQHGNPINVSELSFQIFEKVTNPTIPIQVYPVSGKQSVDLNACPSGHLLETGRYVAEYQIPSDEVLGLHEIRWFSKYVPSADEQVFQEEFTVLADGTLLSDDYYLSVYEVREAGLNTSEIDDGQIQSSICLWQQIIERATRQWFRPISIEMYVDGTDSDTLHFAIPIISIEEIKINSETTALSTDRYKVYNGTRMPDDRKNPRIKLIDSWEYKRDIFTAPDRTLRTRFFKGRQNQYIKGVFGYVESDGSTPLPIKNALLRLVLQDLTNPLIPDPSSTLSPPPLISGIVKEEVTDGHSIKYQISGGGVKQTAAGLSGLIEDPAVRRIVNLYKAPIGMATPANPTWS